MKKHTFEEIEACLRECKYFWETQITAHYKPEPASEESIQEVEKTLGLKFPPDYRRFLLKWGFLEFCYTYSHEIYGIVHDDPKQDKYGSVLGLTLDCREYAELPEHYIAFYSDEGDEIWCIDTQDPDERVVVWDFFGHYLARIVIYSFVDMLYQFAANERRVIIDDQGWLLDEKNEEYEEVDEFVWKNLV
ncbi:MAG: SMI1/KNR4 family protein [Planctomycetia bacterium]|nr:SMI1/KNR4 family protein [Planctomycetia bacterium]